MVHGLRVLYWQGLDGYKMADSKIENLTANTTPVSTDILAMVDDPGGSPTTQKITYANAFKVINDFTADATPDVTNDVAVTYDNSAAAAKKVALRLFGNGLFDPGGRLTLTSGTPVTSSDVTSSTSVYYTPYVNNLITLWNGTTWETLTFTEQTLALGTVTSGLNYDVFGYISSGALAVEKLAWTSTTARATAITLQDGRYCKSGDKTRLYLGTFYTISTTQTADAGGGSVTQTGGKRFVWNMYNRRLRDAKVIDTTNSWSYTTDTTRQANGAAGNKIEFVLGLAEDVVNARGFGVALIAANSTRAAKVGCGLDSTTTFSGFIQGGFNNNAAYVYSPVQGEYSGYPAVGYHYISWNERGADVNCTFLGDNGGDGQQTGLVAYIWA